MSTDAWDFESAMWGSTEEEEAKREARRDSDGNFDGVKYRQWLRFTNNPDGTEVDPTVYRFLDDPGESGIASGSWYNLPYQVSANKGLLDICSGDEMPPGCRSIPMLSWEDPILERVRPYQYNISDRTGKVTPSPVALGQFVDSDGRLQILEMTKRQYETLIDKLNEIRKWTKDPDRSFAGVPLTIAKKGAKGTPGATVLVVDIYDGDDIPELSREELPEPLSFKDHLAQIRDEIAKLIESVEGPDAPGAQRVTTDKAKKKAEAEAVEKTEAAESKAKAKPAASTADADEVTKAMDDLADAQAYQLRELLKMAKVDFPSGARRNTLMKLAAEHKLSLSMLEDQPDF